MRTPRLPPLLVLLPALLAARLLPPAGAQDEDAVTVIGTGTLRKSTLLVRASLERVSTLPYGVEMATLKVAEVLWPAPRGERIGPVQVLSGEPGYFARVTEDSLFFLRRLEGKARFECEGIVDLSDGDGPARLAAVRRSLEVEALPRELRAAALRRSCFESLGAPDAWTRRNAGRELAHLATTRPGAFSSLDAREIAERAMREGDRALRPLLVEAAEALSDAGTRGALAPAEPGRVSLRGAPALRALREEKDPKKRLEALEDAAAEPGEGATGVLVEVLLGKDGPALRAAAAAALGGRPSSPAAVRGLRDARRGGEDPLVLAAAAEALGMLAAAEAIPDLAALAREPDPVGRASLFALGRIGSPAAEAALREIQRRLDPALEATAERRDLVDFLLSPDFRRQEEALRRMRGGR
ncbi:MAG: HEAT repeat domain-containing protein [Planctomycetes bacterium]|nr:HEAT repeat domain-containing protein [Planctomycetota bacterium]